MKKKSKQKKKENKYINKKEIIDGVILKVKDNQIKNKK